jgi:hypothetical protein
MFSASFPRLPPINPSVSSNYQQHDFSTPQQQQQQPPNNHLQAQTAHSMNHLTPHEVLNVWPAAAAHMTTAQNQDHPQDASALWSSVTTTSSNMT